MQAIAHRKELIPPALCTQLRDLATELTDANSAAALRFAKRYIEIIDGRIDWVPVKSWVVVDLTAPDCQLQGANGTAAVNAIATPIDLKRELEAGSGAVDIVVVYDGQCIFCQSYIKLMRLRASAGRVLLLDARQRNIAGQVKAALNLDLDDGMLVLYGDLAYWGADAMHILGTLTSTSDLWNAATAFVFRRRWLARLLYPPLKIGRSLALILLGRPRIRVEAKR